MVPIIHDGHRLLQMPGLRDPVFHGPGRSAHYSFEVYRTASKSHRAAHLSSTAAQRYNNFQNFSASPRNSLGRFDVTRWSATNRLRAVETHFKSLAEDTCSGLGKPDFALSRRIARLDTRLLLFIWGKDVLPVITLIEGRSITEES